MGERIGRGERERKRNNQERGLTETCRETVEIKRGVATEFRAKKELPVSY
jgi:hypothetical protein